MECRRPGRRGSFLSVRTVFPAVPAALLAFVLPLLSMAAAAAEGAKEGKADPRLLDAIPPGCTLQAYDDCGVPERQPHFDMTDSYAWTFQPSDTEADLKSRSAVFSYKSVNAVYEGLDPARNYVLAITCASDHNRCLDVSIGLLHLS